MKLPFTRFWLRALDLGAGHPLLGLGVGLLMAAALVPILNLWQGSSGPLGPSIPLFFLVPVLLASSMGGELVGVLVALVAVFVWDWFFITPLYTVTIYYPRYVLALVVFFAVALLTGRLATAARQRTEEVIRRARSSEALYELSMALIARKDLPDILPDLTRRLRDTFDLEASAVLLPDGQTGAWRTSAAAGEMPSELRVEKSRSVAGVASWVNGQGQVCGLDTDGSHAFSSQFVPLRVGTRPVGVLQLVYRAGAQLDPERERLLTTFANGAAIALEQVRLSREEQAAALARESDRLKSALLSSVSHDLRSPLAGIKAAASSLLQEDVHWSEEDRRAFAVDIDAEADRLTHLVSNLLDLSRIEAGVLKPHKEWEDVTELIGRVLHRLERGLAGHPVMKDIPDTLPTAQLDAVEIEQVLTNLLENAAKYSPPSSSITITARALERQDGRGELQIRVADRGPGIATFEQAHVFDKFFRASSSAGRVTGTGMGLAIVKGFVEAHGGTVSVESAPGQGSTFTVILPLERISSNGAPQDAGSESVEKQASR